MFFNKRKQKANGFDDHEEQFSGFGLSHAPLTQQTSEPSVIAADLVVNGQVRSGGDLHINGTVLGSVEARTCVVETEGRVEGEIRAQAIFVHGHVIGPMNASHIHVFPHAIVRGDLIHETIKIDNGADVLGQFLRHGTNSTAFQRPMRASPSPAAAPPEAQTENGNLYDTIFQNAPEGAANNQSPIVAVQPKAMKR
jgi:cytoskeletal protein CcmA (bactofilin family)